MTVDEQRLDETIRDAVEAHGAAVDAVVPDFGALVATRQRRTRRTLAAATFAVALLGIGGVVLATNRTDRGSDAVSDGSSLNDVANRPTTSDQRPPTPVEYSCTDPVGEDQLGRQLFGACEPEPDGIDGDFACVGRIRSENGFVVFTTCEPVGQLGPMPGTDEDAPFDNPGDIPVRPTVYVVQVGDSAVQIAARFCVSIADLAAANGWTDDSREFPAPGGEILIPVDIDLDADGCEVGRYTITESDTTRIGVADKFCISVQALDTANLETDGYSGFYPGLEILIPPAPDRTC